MQKRRIYNYYKDNLSSISEISFLDEGEMRFSNCWLTTILLEKDSAIDREKLRLYLDKENIEARPLWKPMHLQPVFKNFQAFSNGISEELFDRGLCLPSGTNMKDEDLARVVSKIKEVYAA